MKRTFLAILALSVPIVGPATGEQLAEPPDWTDEVKDVFFEDARTALSGLPPTSQRPVELIAQDATNRTDDAIWRELIAPGAIESAVKASVNRVTQLAKQRARFQAGLHTDCRRELTLLGTLFGVSSVYPDDIRWKQVAPRFEQLCLHAAESCTDGSPESLAHVNDVLLALEGLLRGQVTESDIPTDERLSPEFAPLMQCMELIAEEELSESLSGRTQFRRQAISVSEKAQLLAVLSEVIRGEVYGYADDKTYQAHADKLRDTACELSESAAAGDFEQSVNAAAAIGKACAECHADYRG